MRRFSAVRLGFNLLYPDRDTRPPIFNEHLSVTGKSEKLNVDSRQRCETRDKFGVATSLPRALTVPRTSPGDL
jgi:hypothetical protein